MKNININLEELSRIRPSNDSQKRSPKDDRSDVKNPNNPKYWEDQKNREKQLEADRKRKK